MSTTYRERCAADVPSLTRRTNFCSIVSAYQGRWISFEREFCHILPQRIHPYHDSLRLNEQQHESVLQTKPVG